MRSKQNINQDHAVAASNNLKGKKKNLTLCWQRKLAQVSGNCRFKSIQFILALVMILVTATSLGLTIQNVFLQAVRLDRGRRVFHWFYSIFSTVVLLTLSFLCIQVTLSEPANMDQYTKVGFRLSVIMMSDLLLLVRLSFVDVVVFGWNVPSNSMLVVTYFSPMVTTLTRIVTISIFVYLFSVHLCKSEWTSMCGPCPKCRKEMGSKRKSMGKCKNTPKSKVGSKAKSKQASIPKQQCHTPGKKQ